MRLIPHEHKFKLVGTYCEYWSPIHHRVMRKDTRKGYWQCNVCSRRALTGELAERLHKDSILLRGLVLAVVYPLAIVVLAFVLTYLWRIA